MALINQAPRSSSADIVARDINHRAASALRMRIRVLYLLASLNAARAISFRFLSGTVAATHTRCACVLFSTTEKKRARTWREGEEVCSAHFSDNLFD